MPLRMPKYEDEDDFVSFEEDLVLKQPTSQPMKQSESALGKLLKLSRPKTDKDFVKFWVRQAYESVNDPILVIDESGLWIVFMNSACRSLLCLGPSHKNTSYGVMKVSDCLSSSAFLFERKADHHYTIQVKTQDSLLSAKASVGVLKAGLNSSKAKDDVAYVVTLVPSESVLKPALKSSRYLSEFQELERLGKGGFGAVYKAKNLLDGQDYAIKKVKLSCHPDELRGFDGSFEEIVHHSWDGHKRKISAMDNRLLREVKTFAFLSNHPNVVRYFNAWIEPISAESVSSVMMSRTPSSQKRRVSGQITFKSIADGNDSLSSSSLEDDEEEDYRVHNATLFIQMQIYPYNDLRHWIKQIMSGLAHIHRQNVIHRDIKPDNVFMNDLHIYLGDFGLAKSLTDHVFISEEDLHEGVFPVHDQVEASSNHGTYFYMAPEILSSQICTRKSDVYSCGIVLFELFSMFDTVMERAVTLTNLKKLKELPDEFSKSYPHVAQLVLQMIEDDPNNRPSAEDLLNELLYFADPQFGSRTSSFRLASPESLFEIPSGLLEDKVSRQSSRSLRSSTQCSQSDFQYPTPAYQDCQDEVFQFDSLPRPDPRSESTCATPIPIVYPSQLSRRSSVHTKVFASGPNGPLMSPFMPIERMSASCPNRTFQPTPVEFVQDKVKIANLEAEVARLQTRVAELMAQKS